MRRSFLRTCVVLLLSTSLAFTESTVENGEHNVLVAFSQNVLSQNGMEIIKDMKISLLEASQLLHSAVGLQISKVTFEIPESWTTTPEWNLTVEDSYSSDTFKEDILIDNTNDTVFGKFPFAQQYGRCGTPGHQIIVPTAFFNEINQFPKGIALAREWLKYRYGVFDENGYFNDPLYPLYYHTPGTNASEIHITDCTNSEITYNFKDQKGNECPSNEISIDKLNSHECGIYISEEDFENVTSSFMYFQESISTMTHICGKNETHRHNSRSPNKQNILCHGKSIWDIVSTSSDFKNEDTEKEYAEPEFVFLKKANPRVVVAWENTEKMKSKGKVILNAITKLLVGLPDGSKFRAFSFKENVPNDDYALEDLDGVKVRQNIALGIKSDFVKAENGDYKAAIKKAFSILQTDTEPRGNIIIITGCQDDLCVVLLKDLKDCSQILSIGEGSNLEDFDLPCLEVVKIPMSDEAEQTYEKLTETMERIYPSKVHDKITETLEVEYLKNGTALNVQVDDFTEKVTFWIHSDKQGENFVLKLNEEVKTERKEETYGSVLELSYFPSQAGVIDFSYPYKTDPMLVEIQKTSKAGKYFIGNIIVQDTTVTEDTLQMPVIIYAIVRFGSYPVQNAQVSAFIQTPDGQEIQLKLNDDGRGDPDITLNDGVYSRYFTNFTSQGTYTVSVSVNNKGFGTRYGVDENAGYRTCCGSTLNADKSFMNGVVPRLNEFTKVFETTFTAKSGRPEDGYKPSRINDLKIAEVSDDGIILTWTAPGGEADSGTASSYEIKLFCEEETKTECNTQGAVQVVNQPPPQNYGTEQQWKIKITTKTQLLSIGIIAINEKNKTSDLSNIVEIYRAKETLPEITIEEPETKAGKASKTGTIVGWVIAGASIIACILGVVVYLRKRQHQKPDLYNIEENKDNNKTKSTFEAQDISIKSTPVKKMESFPVLLYTHDQIRDHKNKENDLPLHKLNVPPKQWKSLDVISNLKKDDDRDTKSLDSASTLNLEEDSDKKKNSG